MELTGLTTDTSPSLASAAQGSQNLGQDAFMNLLVEQMKNQDPMNPQSNEDFIAQLANFSSLEQMEQINQNLLGMALLDEGNALLSQLTEGSALIGKQVTWIDPSTGIEQTGEVDSIKIADGLSKLSIGDVEVPLFFVTEVLGEAAEVDTTDGGDSSDGSDDSDSDSTDA